MPGGVGGRVWDGNDDDGVHQTSGRYTVQVTLHDADENLIGKSSVDILMALLVLRPLALTDAGGRIRVTDRRIFPHLYSEKDAMTARDEGGDPLGPIELDETMLFYFFNQDRTQWQAIRRAVMGSGRLTFVWDPESV